MFAVVAARGGRRRTVAAQTRKAAVPVREGVTVITGTNMWALLSDDDPGHGGAKPAERGKKTRPKKMKNAAGGSKKAAVTVDDDEETPAGELEEEMSEEEEAMTGEAATVSSRCRTCRTMASRVWRVFPARVQATV